MAEKIYGLTRSGSRYFYALDDQALAVELAPHPKAWQKTPWKPWKRLHGNILKLDMLGFGILQLDPLAEFDHSAVEVCRLIPSDGNFEYEPDWHDVISFSDWAKDNNWQDTLSEMFAQIDPVVLEKLRQFSHFHLRFLEALNEWPGFKDLLDVNPFLASALAGRIRVGSQGGTRRSPLDYGSLVLRSEKEIAATLGFGDSEEVVTITRKIPPDACKPHELKNFPEYLQNPATLMALLDADLITYPALLLLRSPVLAANLTGAFLSDFGRIFPKHIDILCCSWAPLLRGEGKGEEFTWTYQQALDVVQANPDVVIESVEDLKRKHAKGYWAYRW